MSIRIPVCYTHPNDPSYNNNSYECNGNVFIAPNGSNVVPPSGNAFITPIQGVNYSEGVYPGSNESRHRDRSSSSDSSNKSPSRMAEKDRRRDLKKMEKKQEGGFLQKMMNVVKDPLHK